MTDSTEQLQMLLIEVAKKLKSEPQADSKRLLAYLNAVILENPDLNNAAKRMIQINQDDVRGFQTLVQSGTALVGYHYHVDKDTLKVVLKNLITEHTGGYYTRLQNLLAADKWEEADKETLHVMLKVSPREREREGWLDISSMRTFPSTDLLTIDQLWVKYSSQRFGFSVQKKIYLSASVGGKADGRSDPKAWKRFCECVGWRIKEDWWTKKKEIKLTYDISAPDGHLPISPFHWQRLSIGYGSEDLFYREDL